MKNLQSAANHVSTKFLFKAPDAPEPSELIESTTETLAPDGEMSGAKTEMVAMIKRLEDQAAASGIDLSENGLEDVMDVVSDTAYRSGAWLEMSTLDPMVRGNLDQQLQVVLTEITAEADAAKVAAAELTAARQAEVTGAPDFDKNAYDTARMIEGENKFFTAEANAAKAKAYAQSDDAFFDAENEAFGIAQAAKLEATRDAFAANQQGIDDAGAQAIRKAEFAKQENGLDGVLQAGVDAMDAAALDEAYTALTKGADDHFYANMDFAGLNIRHNADEKAFITEVQSLYKQKVREMPESVVADLGEDWAKTALASFDAATGEFSQVYEPSWNPIKDLKSQVASGHGINVETEGPKILANLENVSFENYALTRLNNMEPKTVVALAGELSPGGNAAVDSFVNAKALALAKDGTPEQVAEWRSVLHEGGYEADAARIGRGLEARQYAAAQGAEGNQVSQAAIDTYLHADEVTSMARFIETRDAAAAKAQAAETKAHMLEANSGITAQPSEVKDVVLTSLEEEKPVDTSPRIGVNIQKADFGTIRSTGGGVRLRSAEDPTKRIDSVYKGDVITPVTDNNGNMIRKLGSELGFTDTEKKDMYFGKVKTESGDKAWMSMNFMEQTYNKKED